MMGELRLAAAQQAVKCGSNPQRVVSVWKQVEKEVGVEIFP